MKILNFQHVLAILAITSLSACSWFGDSVDPVLAGSLTLTPLNIPTGLSSPNGSQALSVPNVDQENAATDSSNIAEPPPLDLAQAKEEAVALSSDMGPETGKMLILSSEIQIDPDGQGMLVFKSSFDRVWENMDSVITKLGFRVDDRDRSKNLYEISRGLPKSLAQEVEEKDTGVERQTGQQEKYKIFVKNISKERTEVGILNPVGQPDGSSLAKHLLVQIKAAFEQPLK